MYPVLRMGLGVLAARRQAPLPVDGVHVTHHTCMPWDLDMWVELNNGRTLTLLDIGRIQLAMRTGLIAALRRERWGLTMAGVSVRYRRRIRAFDRFEVRSQCVGRDARFLYLHQTIWKGGEAACSALYRSAVTDASGIVASDRVAAAMGHAGWNPELPGWIQSWIAAEAERPWPPEHVVPAEAAPTAQAG